MKTLGTLILIFIFSINSIGGINEPDKKNTKVEVNAQEVKGARYFSLKITNEQDEGFYTLVCENDGKESLIDVKDAVPNDLNEPIWYSFVDSEMRTGKSVYTLRRITAESVEVLAEWQFYTEEVVNPAAFVRVENDENTQSMEK